MGNSNKNQFGGEWTQTKLDILKNYLDAYTTALKNQSFRLLYVDAFAGSGEIELRTDDPDRNDLREFIDGSAKIALKIKNKPFDQLIFIENDAQNCAKLKTLKSENPDRNIRIKDGNANHVLQNLQINWQASRGVLFLDPFGAQVDWATLEVIAGYKALDIWILFPTSAIARMLPESKNPNDISEQWAPTLTRVYGNESWRQLYAENSVRDLFSDSSNKSRRAPGVEGLIKIYKKQLKVLLGTRFLDQSIALKNTRNSPLYEFMFCVGSDKDGAVGIAKKIAKHLLDL